MFDALLIVVFGVLLINVVIAFVVTARRPVTDRWLLSLLLTGTTGAALVILLVMILDAAASSRFLDVAVVLIGLASLTAAVRLTAAGPVPSEPDVGEQPAAGGDGERA